MPVIIKRNARSIFLFTILSVLVSACAQHKVDLKYADDASGSWPDKKLEKAYARYWEKRFHGPVDQLLELEAPYFQEMVAENNYQILVKSFVKNDLKDIQIYDVQKVEGTDHLYTVYGKMSFIDASGKERQMDVPDLWVTAGGNWYHVIKDPVLFPMVR